MNKDLDTKIDQFFDETQGRFNLMYDQIKEIKRSDPSKKNCIVWWVTIIETKKDLHMTVDQNVTVEEIEKQIGQRAYIAYRLPFIVN